MRWHPRPVPNRARSYHVSLPDVTVTKGLAAVMTATLIAYVGIDTFWSLVVGFKRLMGEAERATTFHGLREAGEHYRKVIGHHAARAFAMVAMGNTAPGLAAKVPKLAGSMRKDQSRPAEG